MKVLYCNHALIEAHLREAVIMSGLPKHAEVTCHDFKDCAQQTTMEFLASHMSDLERAIKLGACAAGSGHDSFLKGIVVSAVIEAPQYWWLQAQRYHFFEIVSSQSKMHRIAQMDLDKQCDDLVYSEIIAVLESAIDLYRKEKSSGEEALDRLHRVIANTPMGLKLTAGVVTNYRQLKTMYFQRKDHRLKDWREDFVNWVEGLPMFMELCIGGGRNA